MIVSSLQRLFCNQWPLIGVIHLPALPGTPFNECRFPEIRDRAETDAEILAGVGFDGIIVENFGDRPFSPESVEPHIVSAMTLVVEHVASVARRVKPNFSPVIGVNVLRNDAFAAVGIAAVTSARFVRINVHIGAMVADQGVIQGNAFHTLSYRRRLDSDVAIMADVMVKHASPLGIFDLESTAKDTYFRGGADALILSGSGTGEPTSRDELGRIKEAVCGAPVLVGSGLTVEQMPDVRHLCDGAIVGTALKVGGEITRLVDFDRALAFVETRDSLM